MLAAILQAFGEAQVDRLDGLVMECINCGSVNTGGCGRMERFQMQIADASRKKGCFFFLQLCLLI